MGNSTGNCSCWDDQSNVKKVTLNLPKLKILVFYWFELSPPLVVDCPMLSVLVYDGEYKETVKLKHSETIRKLDTWMSGSKLAQFKNVECLVALVAIW